MQLNSVLNLKSNIVKLENFLYEKVASLKASCVRGKRVVGKRKKKIYVESKIEFFLS